MALWLSTKAVKACRIEARLRGSAEGDAAEVAGGAASTGCDEPEERCTDASELGVGSCDLIEASDMGVNR